MSTTQRLARLEAAQELLGVLMASLAEQIHAENQKAQPDKSKITQWDADRKALFDLEDGLRLDDQTAIDEVISTYGPAARAVFHGQ